jgi:rubrerythrin
MAKISCSSFDDVVGFAIEKEEAAMSFYQKCADRAKNPGIKEFFVEMVAEERKHRDLLQMTDINALEKVKLEKVEDLKLSDYMVDVAFRDDLTYQEALALAMKKEEKAILFYAAWRQKCVHEKTARLFEILEHEETKHKRHLEEIYDEQILSWD